MTDARYTVEHGTRTVAWITPVMMIVEIWIGWHFNSMALVADGWHMSTHALAIGLSAAAYAVARRYAGDPRFASGTRKIVALAAYSSALVLLGIAAAMIVGSVDALVRRSTQPPGAQTCAPRPQSALGLPACAR